MRQFIGIFIAVIIVTGAVLSVLALWGIQPISWSVVWRSGVTIGIVSIVLLVIRLIAFLFFKKDPFNLNKNKA